MSDPHGASRVDDLRRQLRLAQERIAELERLLARDQALLLRTHAELDAIQSTQAWRLVRFVYARIGRRILPQSSRRYRWLKSAVDAGVDQVERVLRRRRSESAPGGRLGRSEVLDDAMYRRWIHSHEPRPERLARQRLQRFAWEPLISVVVPVYRPPIEYLRAALESVRRQTYARWELCLADASDCAEISRLLRELAARDPRVRLRELPENLGIAGNTNAALALARGDFVAFLDHDDELAPFALFEVASALAASPDADLVYSDEDKLDARGRRTQPHFKPDWSPEHLLSRNYVCHLAVVRRTLLEDLGGLRLGFDGAQDHDLILRVSERTKRIVHVPEVLYHWRMHAGSAAQTADAKPDASEAGRRAVEEHLRRVGTPAEVTHREVPGLYRVRYRLGERPLVSAIIPNRDQAARLRRCLDALRDNDDANLEVLVVENGSTRDETFELYREVAGRTGHRLLAWKEPFNYSAVNNHAARHARGELLLFLNNDVEGVHRSWLAPMVELAVQPGVGAVGAKLLYPDRTIQHGGVIIGMQGAAGHSHLRFPADAPGYMRRLRFPHNCSAVTGACLLVPRRVFEQVGGFDEAFELAFGDIDLCLVIRRAGYRIVWTPDAELVHHESSTRGYEDTPEKRLRFGREVELFARKWRDTLAAGDPYYSPHFSLDRCDWVLRGT
jgi:GT2 family glycosyltransferase